jgi:hypothetical protein
MYLKMYIIVTYIVNTNHLNRLSWKKFLRPNSKENLVNILQYNARNTDPKEERCIQIYNARTGINHAKHST